MTGEYKRDYTTDLHVNFREVAPPLIYVYAWRIASGRFNQCEELSNETDQKVRASFGLWAKRIIIASTTNL